MLPTSLFCRLCAEFEAIAEKAGSVPTTTAELMTLIEFMKVYNLF